MTPFGYQQHSLICMLVSCKTKVVKSPPPWQVAFSGRVRRCIDQSPSAKVRQPRQHHGQESILSQRLGSGSDIRVWDFAEFSLEQVIQSRFSMAHGRLRSGTASVLYTVNFVPNRSPSLSGTLWIKLERQTPPTQEAKTSPFRCVSRKMNSRCFLALANRFPEAMGSL